MIYQGDNSFLTSHQMNQTMDNNVDVRLGTYKDGDDVYVEEYDQISQN